MDRADGGGRGRVLLPCFDRGPLRGGTAVLLLAIFVAAACTGADDGGETGEDAASDTTDPPSSVPAPAESLALPDAPAEACTAVLETGLAIGGRTRTGLRAELGEPDSVVREAVPNRHVPGATDTVVTMRWPAVTAVVRVAREKELVEAIRITDGRHLRYGGVGPGTPRDSIVARLGEPGRHVGGDEPDPVGRREPGRAGAEPSGVPDPAESEPETLSYWCPSEPGAESPVLFHFRDGRVAMVEWDFYVD